MMQAINRTRHTTLVMRGEVARSMWARMRGLLGHRPLQDGEGLLLPGEKAIHMVGMKFALDVVFIDSKRRVVHVMPNVRPMQFSPFVFRANDVLEMPVGVIERTQTAIGDEIELTFT
jgi:uncharacterized membrane protein (UPF0127 family)